MASEAQIAANRRNAQASTGPRTDEGKARVARNGLKHGLCAADPVLPWEDRAEFEALVADLAARLRPADEIELALLLQYADATWRRQRCAILETGLLGGAMPETAEGCPEGVHPTAWALGEAWMARGKEINRLSLHESRLARLAERALDRLAAAQSRRQQAEAELALESRSQSPSPARRPDLHPDPLPQEREREPDQGLAPELALDSQIGQKPSPASAGEGRDPSRSDGEGEGQRTAWSRSPNSARRPDPHPDPLPQEREREPDQGLAAELASFLRNAA
jgi:hypothetical protein